MGHGFKMKRLTKWFGSLFQSRQPDWDAYEANLVKDGWEPDRARADRLEEEFSTLSQSKHR